MKNKIFIVSIGLIMFVSFLLNSFSEQKTEWKGVIDTKEGIKIVRNPVKKEVGNVRSFLNDRDIYYFIFCI